MTPPTSLGDWIVYVISGGGALALLREGRQWWNRRQSNVAAAPEKRALVESQSVATAAQVVKLVDERMGEQAIEIKALRAEVVTLRKRVDLLEDELRDNNIPIP